MTFRAPRTRSSRLLGHARTGDRADLSRVLAAQKRRLRELEARDAIFAEVFQRMPSPIALARARDATYIEVNEALVAASGYRRDELVGKRSIALGIWSSREEGEAVLAKLSQQGFLHDEQVRLVDRLGNEHVLLMNASPIEMNGEACVVWHATDVTERMRDDEVRRELESRLEKRETLARLGTMAGAIAHDFNNLLVSVLGNADLLLMQLEADSPLRGLVSSIMAGAQRGAEHTRELLDYAGRGGGKFKPIALASLLDDVLGTVRPLVKPHVSIVHRPAEEPLWLEGDHAQLKRLFVNLLRHAAEALAGEPGQVELEVTRKGDSCAITIRDQGQGVDESVVARMFEPFSSAKYDGRGLRLISVPGIVERHVGQLDVTSIPGEGTSLFLRFPLCAAPDLPPRPEETPRTQAGRVLVVDDEPEVRSLAALFVSELGFLAEHAEGGRRALELLERARDEAPYAWVLLDATMPDMDGATVLEQIRTADLDLPVLLCSGYSRTDFTTLFASQKRVSFLTKPYRLSELRAAVDQLLEEGSS